MGLSFRHISVAPTYSKTFNCEIILDSIFLFRSSLTSIKIVGLIFHVHNVLFRC